MPSVNCVVSTHRLHGHVVAQNRPKSPKTPKIDAGAGGVRSAGWVKKADLTGAITPKIDAQGYQYRKIKSGRP